MRSHYVRSTSCVIAILALSLNPLTPTAFSQDREPVESRIHSPSDRVAEKDAASSRLLLLIRTVRLEEMQPSPQSRLTPRSVVTQTGEVQVQGAKKRTGLKWVLAAAAAGAGVAVLALAKGGSPPPIPTVTVGPLTVEQPQ